MAKAKYGHQGLSGKTYAYTLGSQFAVDAQTAGEELEMLEAKYGKLQAETILKEAKKRNHPLHRCFEWNDRRAAIKFRISRAKDLIRAVIIVKEDGKRIADPPRAFVRVAPEDGDGGSYISLLAAMSSAEKRDYVLDQVFEELETYKAKFRRYKRLHGIFAALDKAKAAHVRAKKKSKKVKKVKKVKKKAKKVKKKKPKKRR